MNPENQFDFWLGEWDAHWGEDGKATNTITRILDGKIVQEDFVAPDLHGLSFSSYDPERKLWCQTWGHWPTCLRWKKCIATRP